MAKTPFGIYLPDRLLRWNRIQKPQGQPNDQQVDSLLDVNMDGQKEILGIWISENENASLYASICSDLKNRGTISSWLAMTTTT